MVIRVNGLALDEWAGQRGEVTLVEQPFGDKKRTATWWPIAVAMTMAILTKTKPVYAADPMSGMWPLVAMIQGWAKPIGIGLALWGLIDWALGNPDGKQRIKIALIMYVGVFLIPQIFNTIDASFSGR